MSRTNIRFAKTSKLLCHSYTVILVLVLMLPKPTRAQTDNTAYGTGALARDTSGEWNSAFGFDALFDNQTGIGNTAVGYLALYNSTGNNNTATGAKALYGNTGNWNTANGYGTLYLNTTGSQNTADGYKALLSNTTGNQNTAEGYEALYSNTTGTGNTANGFKALYSSTTVNAAQNTAIGAFALYSSPSGLGNTAIGYDALGGSTTEILQNTAIGAFALRKSTSGFGNIALGFEAGSELTTESSNIDIGSYGAPGDEGTIRIGNGQSAAYIDGIYGVTAAGGIEVYVDSSGQLGTKSSSARFKEAIQPMDKASEAILALKPVTFHYKKELDQRGIPQFGLVAEQVEKVNPDLVTRDKKGQVYSVRYEAVNAMLLNEFLKEHQRVQELQERLDAMAAQMKEQARLIEEVSGLVKTNNFPRQVATNTK
jgi:hypothetical protein